MSQTCNWNGDGWLRGHSKTLMRSSCKVIEKVEPLTDEVRQPKEINY